MFVGILNKFVLEIWGVMLETTSVNLAEVDCWPTKSELEVGAPPRAEFDVGVPLTLHRPISQLVCCLVAYSKTCLITQRSRGSFDFLVLGGSVPQNPSHQSAPNKSSQEVGSG